MTLTFPKNQQVHVIEKEFTELMLHFVTAIENHLTYTDGDEVTEVVWNDLKCNGIDNAEFHTIQDVAHMLEITDEKDMNIGHVVEMLFETVHILKYYFTLIKVNVKSVKIKRNVITDVKKLFQQLKDSSKSLPQATDFVKINKPKVQSKLVVTKASDVMQVEPFSSISDDESKAVETPVFEAPKKTVPRKEAIDTNPPPMDNSNAYSALSFDDDDIHDEDDGLSFDSNSPKSAFVESSKDKSTLDVFQNLDKATADRIADCIAKGLQDKTSVDELTAWIMGDMAPIATEYMQTSIDTYSGTAFKRMEVRLKNTFVTLQQSVQKALNETEVNLVTNVQQHCNQMLEIYRHNIDTIDIEAKEVKDEFMQTMTTTKDSHKQELTKLHDEFQHQCKEFLEDHVLNRRTIFTNQKATFDNDIRAMKSDFEQYIGTMQSVKADLSDEIETLQNQINETRNALSNELAQYKLELRRSYDSIRKEFDSHQQVLLESQPHGASVSQPTSVSETIGGPTPVKNNSHPSSLPETPPEESNFEPPFTPGTIVTVRRGMLLLPKAEIFRSHFNSEGDLCYELFTDDSRYTFEARYVTKLDTNSKKPSPIPSHAPSSSFQHIRSTKLSKSPHYHSSRDRHNNQYRSDSFDKHDTDDEVEFIRSTRPLMPNQFRYKGQPREITINTTNMLRYASDWNLKWDDVETDPKDFYEDLRNRVENYGIVLKHYMDIDKDTSICAVTSNDIHNYDKAFYEMSKSLYSVINTYKNDWFGSNPKLDLLHHYGENRDGFGLVKEMLADSHPQLQEITKAETMDKPKLVEFNTWFSYMKQYRKWVDFERRTASKREYTPEEHVANILKQISDIPMFKVAKEKLEDKMLKMDEQLFVFPKELELQRIGLTIYNWIPRDQRHSINLGDTSKSEMFSETIHKLNQERSRVRNPYKSKDSSGSSQYPRRNSSSSQQTDNTKYQRDARQKDSFPYPPIVPPGSRQWEDVICSACGEAGHDILIQGCDNTAKQTKIEEWKRKNRQHFDRNTVLELYEQHQKQKRNKRVSGKRRRNELRRDLRIARAEMSPEAYREAKDLYIHSFIREHPDDDLKDPREDNLEEIRPYDILDSENESSGDEQ